MLHCVGREPQPFLYSPLLLRATFLAAGEHWINVTMLTVCVLFFLSLATLPPAHSWRDLFIALFATLSSATFLVAERGNADLILFLMIIAAVNLRIMPLALRLGGYSRILRAGRVKFYPFVALIVVLRERASCYCRSCGHQHGRACDVAVLPSRTRVDVRKPSRPVVFHPAIRFGEPAGWNWRVRRKGYGEVWLRGWRGSSRHCCLSIARYPADPGRFGDCCSMRYSSSLRFALHGSQIVDPPA